MPYSHATTEPWGIEPPTSVTRPPRVHEQRRLTGVGVGRHPDLAVLHHLARRLEHDARRALHPARSRRGARQRVRRHLAARGDRLGSTPPAAAAHRTGREQDARDVGQPHALHHHREHEDRRAAAPCPGTRHAVGPRRSVRHLGRPCSTRHAPVYAGSSLTSRSAKGGGGMAASASAVAHSASPG